MEIKQSEEILNDIVNHVKGLRAFIQENGEINNEQQRFIDSNTKFIYNSTKKYILAIQKESTMQFKLDKFNKQYDLCLKNINPFDILSGKVVILPNKSIFWFKEEGYNMNSNGLPIYENLYREDSHKPIMINFMQGSHTPMIIYKYGDNLILYNVMHGGFTHNPTGESDNDLFKKYNCIVE